MTVTVAGKYRAKPIAWGAKTTNAGAPNLAIKFLVTSDGPAKDAELFWQGGLNPEGKDGKKSQQEITFDALEACGFDFQKHKNLMAFAEGPGAAALNVDQEVMLTVEIETWEGKPQPRVRWVNDLSGGKFKGAIGPQDFLAKCSGLGIEAGLMRRRAGTVRPGPAVSQPENFTPDLADLPF